MSFHLSAENVRVEENHILVANLKNNNGEYHQVAVDLNVHIGNNNGHFQWGGKDFSQTARNVHFGIEGGASVPVLRAELRTPNGDWVGADVNLDERVINNNGQFEFQY
ncbi:hypothetical protein ASPWEDRAFT_103856 [Aspergillus wentii DTO 134E9]|uniref:Cyanovirin-N domain-containing protein n=1 Tax=Aspergillus wentii DTO 134E9 TaxID=1073089 RepID=A0A1L9RW99_ASPWE|nr:uncharacterized protein ASPWEDRAFT_103856 [Aspergillus wentii DTO 134E9]KAI9929086.1 hypothetical protein MW887_001490 [Aspergillus wentii]OJJ39220.1 hypothetical protein ASPWEDRAFT_103856 [Aspergillus wentii DTO 134E9]